MLCQDFNVVNVFATSFISFRERRRVLLIKGILFAGQERRIVLLIRGILFADEWWWTAVLQNDKPKNIYVYVPVYQTALDLIGMRYGIVWKFDEGYFLKYFLFEN